MTSCQSCHTYSASTPICWGLCCSPLHGFQSPEEKPCLHCQHPTLQQHACAMPIKVGCPASGRLSGFTLNPKQPARVLVSAPFMPVQPVHSCAASSQATQDLCPPPQSPAHEQAARNSCSNWHVQEAEACKATVPILHPSRNWPCCPEMHAKQCHCLAGRCRGCGRRTAFCWLGGSRGRAAGLPWASLRLLPLFTATRQSIKRTLCASCQLTASTTGLGRYARLDLYPDPVGGIAALPADTNP